MYYGCFAVYNGPRFVEYVRAATQEVARRYAVREYGRNASASTLGFEHNGAGPDRNGCYPHNAKVVR